ncbi:MAG: hypothetical protein JXB14_05810, partial [Candidatus Altiarchaeota archaeon]|nr:hypothetical protein [Candidatus Altiarchaeota archaeon]
IGKAIQSRAKFEGTILEDPTDVNSIKRIFHLQSLWIVEGEKPKKFGTVNYKKELEEFDRLKKKFADLAMVKMQRSNDKYYVLEREGKLYAFSTAIDLFSNDIFILLKELDRLQNAERSRTKKKLAQ